MRFHLKFNMVGMFLVILVVFSDSVALSASIPAFFVQKYSLGSILVPKNDQTKLEIEAAAFRSLKSHLMEKRTDVQNIDLMNLAGFCRNCLSRWYQEAANERGVSMDKEQARELFYGMTMKEWKTNYQTDPDQNL